MNSNLVLACIEKLAALAGSVCGCVSSPHIGFVCKGTQGRKKSLEIRAAAVADMSLGRILLGT